MDFLKKLNKKIRQFFVFVISFFSNIFGKRKTAKKTQHDLDKKLVLSLSKSRIPSPRQLKYIKRYLNPRELFIIRASIFVIFLSVLFLFTRFYITHLKVVPVSGGTYVEGIVGAPKLINPLYVSINDVDSDIGSLVFSSLFKRDQNGQLVPDLVTDYTVEDDGKKYVFEIRENVKWHDGRNLTVDDILFTFNLIKDKKFNSPLRSSFLGVSIEKDADNKNKFYFSLTEPYAAFLDLLDFGILSKELWFQSTADSILLDPKNFKPIGSGPYKFKDYVKGERSGIRQYNLEVNNDYYAEIPMVDISFKFFVSYEELIGALNSGTIDGVSYLPREYKEEIIVPKTYSFNRLFLPQMTLLFFNDQNNVALGDKSVREALARAIDKNYIVNQVLGGDAYVVDGPILPNSFAYNPDIKKYEYNTDEARKLLEDIDWKIYEITDEILSQSELDKDSEEDEVKEKAEKILDMGKGTWRMKENDFLKIKITTIDTIDNNLIVQALKDYWEKIGIKIEVEIVDVMDVQTQVIKNKNFEVLFYGEVLGSDPDPYAFWHSSQVSQDGLNIASYNNKEVDQILEEARSVNDVAERQKKYMRFQEVLVDEIPVIFMYSPVYTYIQSHKLKGFDVDNILSPKNRFSNIHEWYLETGKKIIW